MYELPTSVTINNHHYAITNKGDYRMVIDCFLALDDPELESMDRVWTALIIFYEDLEDLEDVFGVFGDEDTVLEAVEQMYRFFNCGQDNPVGYQSNHKLIDWEQDEQLIASAVNKVAGKEIRWEPYIHWWTFMGYYTAVGRGALATVVGIRDKIARGKKLDKQEQEFRRDNPHYFIWKNKTAEEQNFDDYVRRMWNANTEKVGEQNG